MMTIRHLLATLLLTSAMTVNASGAKPPDGNFMLVLREAEGANKQQFGLTPTGPSTATLSNGETVTLNNVWFDLIGDMHIRFVFDGEHSMQNLTAEEFSAYDLPPEEAVAIAIANIKARYGQPRATPWEDGIMLVAGESPDLDSSYFLDHAYWDDLLVTHPEGVVVGVPKRGGLIYAPFSDKAAIATLERSILSLYETSENMRVSSGLYLYKDGSWTVYRSPASLN